MKACTCCGLRKPLEDFYKAALGSDGREAICKPCRKDKSQQWRRENEERNRAANRSWYERNKERAAAVAKSWRASNPDRIAEMGARARERYPEKAAARRAVNNALRSGRLSKPQRCERCGSETPSPRLHGHHADYSEPLEVEWLCVTCHTAEHEQTAIAEGVMG